MKLEDSNCQRALRFNNHRPFQLDKNKGKLQSRSDLEDAAAEGYWMDISFEVGFVEHSKH